MQMSTLHEIKKNYSYHEIKKNYSYQSLVKYVLFIYFFDKVTGVECAKHKSDVQSLEHTEI